MSATRTLAPASLTHQRQAAAPEDTTPEPAITAPAPPTQRKLEARLTETLRHFWDLGCTAFGGPGVHVVIFRRRFVDKLRWLDDTTFTELFALCNALPGPASTKLNVTIATLKNGAPAGLLAFLFWALPGAAGMAGIGAAVRSFPETLPPVVLALLTGLNASAVGLIALAAYQLSNSSVTDGVTRLLVLGSASFGICYHAPWMYPMLIAVGGLTTLVWDSRQAIFTKAKSLARRRSATRNSTSTQASAIPAYELESVSRIVSRTSQASVGQSIRSRNAATRLAEQAVLQEDPSKTITQMPEYHLSNASLMVMTRKKAILCGSALVIAIVALVVTRSEISTPPRWLDFFTNMTIAGVIIFGGGPVVVPLLRGYTVAPGWVESRDFLLGFAILQAFPGPNFNFAVYLGVLAVPSSPALGAILGFIGIFAPGNLLMICLLPLYDLWRKNRIAKSVLRGLNAAATGLIYTAVWQLFLVGYIYTAPSSDSTIQLSASGPLTTDPFWGVVASCAFVATQWYGSSPPVTIAGGALAGLAWFGVVGDAGTMRQPL